MLFHDGSFVFQARTVVLSRNSCRMGTCVAMLLGQADVPADLHQYIGDPRAPGDPLLGTLGYRQPRDPAASRAYQAASQAAHGQSTAQPSSSSQQPASASASSTAAASTAGPSLWQQWPRPPPPPPPPGSMPEAVGEPQEVE